jgi:DNA (cytosine-5)-methyltransferase 1
MKVLDLFSGIGGFTYGLERAGFETVAFCEIDEWCVKNALSTNWPDIYVHNDIKTLDYHYDAAEPDDCLLYDRELDHEICRGTIDIVTAGVPCQPASIIGKRKGCADDRWLWPDALRIIRRVRPKWVICENPTGILSLDGGDRFAEILQGFSEAGYAVWWETIPATAVGAGHRRERVWIIAHAGSQGLERYPGDEQIQRYAQSHGSAAPQAVFPARDTPEWWKDQSPVPIVVNGVPSPSFWKQAVIATGNAVLPQIPEIIGRSIMGLETSS